ncbi:hypothetical protein DPEC_G00044580 [Dallia pectoralis]|uniref:Uncharacterized protein n=1 Tax=Dallia pectoralis TaxID=75939 RepID=A0ACC2H9V0_DALPE|nr:hypothetical protein DPEC_G00044580 [Dallia pectoralis]
MPRSLKSKRASEATPSMADNVHNNGAASCPLSQAVTRADLHEFQEAMFAKLSVLIAGQLQSAIEAILKLAIDAAMGPITSVLDGIGVAVEAQGRQISDLEQGLSDYSGRAGALELAVTRLSSECRQMADRVEITSLQSACGTRRQYSGEQLHFRGKKIQIFPDFTSVVAKKRAAFVDVKRILHEKKIRFSLRFPAILLVNHNGENLRFASPAEAKAWLGRVV